MKKTSFKDLIGLSFVDTIYKTLTFRDFCITALPCLQKRLIRKVRRQQQALINLCRSKDCLTVVFFLQSASIWKYDNLYKLFKNSRHFKPIVVISPYNVHLMYDREECKSVMRKAMDFAAYQGYDYVCSYDFCKDKWLDVKKLYNPDIVFFSKPYKDTLPAYHIYRFKDRLTLYASYGITCLQLRISTNLPFHNLLWKNLVETDFHKRNAELNSLCKGDNALVTGCLGTEKLIDSSYVPTYEWKPQDRIKKRIIWAPHHTVDYLFNFSNFLSYCDFMLDVADRYKDSLQLVFKPHPVLKFKLINIWGKEKTEKYYARWADGENTQIEEGYYMDLFLTSDALIHDCVSFTAEYLYTCKPVLFMVRNPEIENEFNNFAKHCFNVHYHSTDQKGIEDFINNVVIAGKDPMAQDRESFARDYLLPKDGILPSQKIFTFLKDTLNKH